MKRTTPALIALAAGAATLLSNHPAAAHGLAAGGWAGGLAHPLLGLDHLLMLLAVGAAGALLSRRLLLWAGVGALLGALAGVSGLPVPAAEVWASLAVAAMGGLLLFDPGVAGLTFLAGPLVAAGVALHALLHGQEAPVAGASVLWWSGALFSSLLVCGGAFQVFARLPQQSLSRAAALAFLLAGGALAMAPVILPLVAGGAAG